MRRTTDRSPWLLSERCAVTTTRAAEAKRARVARCTADNNRTAFDYFPCAGFCQLGAYERAIRATHRSETESLRVRRARCRRLPQWT